MQNTVIETPRLILRAWRDEDRAPFAAMNADPEVMRYFPAPYTREESDAMVDRISAMMAERGFGFYAVEEKGGAPFIGFVGLSVPRFEAAFTPCVEIGWRLVRSSWGQGYATEAAQAARDDGFERLGLNEIVSFTAVPNEPSQRVMQRIGFRHEPYLDFDHPLVEEGNWLRRHVLYRLDREGWEGLQTG